MVQSSLSSYLSAAGSHKQTLTFSGTRTRRHDISGWTRARLRSGVGVAFDTVSTILDRSLNDDARPSSTGVPKVADGARPVANTSSVFNGSAAPRLPQLPACCAAATAPGRAAHAARSDTILSWNEPESGIDYALSFQEPDGCTELWEQICSLQGRPADGRAGAEPDAVLCFHESVGCSFDHSGLRA